MLNNKKYLVILTLVFLTALLAAVTQQCANQKNKIKNIIIMIPDGCGISHMSMARWFKGSALHQDSLPVTLVRTWCANSIITGSAAAATAFACGYKTWEDDTLYKCIAMLGDSTLIPQVKGLKGNDRFRPVATVLEASRLMGKSTGLVVTSRVSHATPAAFAAHWHDRDYENIIMEQMVYQNIDVVLGGGMRHMVDTMTNLPHQYHRVKGKRKDNENLYQTLSEKGYKIVFSREQLLSVEPQTRKLWGLFAPSHLARAMDRARLAPNEPSLVEMTNKAIELLSNNKKGFFLLVEGSQVDWASHDNDPASVATEYCAFDSAVGAALKYARGNNQTILLIVPDHDNGGITLGRDKKAYSRFTPQQLNEWLDKPKLSAWAVENILKEKILRQKPDTSAIRAIVSKEYGLDDLTSTEIRQLADAFADTLERNRDGSLRLDKNGKPIVNIEQINLRMLLGPMLSQRASIGWTTYEHHGSDVPLFSYGLTNPPASIDNTEIARLCGKAFGFSLDSTTSRLICEADSVFPKARLFIDTAGVLMSKGSLKIEYKGKKVLFPFFKNIAIFEQDTVEMEGLTLYSLHTNKVYLPKQASKLF